MGARWRLQPPCPHGMFLPRRDPFGEATPTQVDPGERLVGQYPLCGVAWAFLPSCGEVTRHAEWLRHSLTAGESASSGHGTCAIDMDHGSGHHRQGVPLDSEIGDLTFGGQLLRNLNTSKRFACRASNHGRTTPEIVTTFTCFF